MSLSLVVLGFAVGIAHVFYENGKQFTCTECDGHGSTPWHPVCSTCNGTGKWWLP